MQTESIPPSRPLEPTPAAIVIGASSGTGAALVRRLAAQGYAVAAVARREEELERLRDEICRSLPQAHVLVVPHDVRDYEAVPALFEEITRKLGGLDLVIYSAAVQPPVNVHEYNFEKDQSMIETNILGAIAWLNQAAMRFERARRGQIVGISSIAGDRGRVGSPVYNTSKAALDTYLEALRNRLSRYGVTVTTIKLGFVDTELLKNAAKTFWVISPEEAAARILAAARQRKQVVYTPRRWQLVSLVVRTIPSPIFRYLNF
ncbi:MAG: SDR family NAD(P)-dependent oxidoreductase [Chloroflexota bacterium]